MVLTLATWLHGGYAFGVWPQLAPLENALRLGHGLEGDWYTAHPAPHWLFAHAAALVPEAWLAPVFAAAWLAGVAFFWAGFAALGSDLAIPGGAILAGGLIGARTAFAGLGSMSLLTPFLYPSNLACVGWLFALREAFRGRAAGAGLAAGLAMLLQPLVGLLTLVTAGIVLLRTARAGAAVRFAAVALIVGGFALARLVADLGSSAGVTARERFELLAIVRLPHHLVYRAFRPEEYVMVALWALVLAVGMARYRPAHEDGVGRTAGWTVLLDSIVMLCLAGAIASSLGWPLVLVELQTARASAWIPLLGLLAAAAALARSRPWTGTLALLAVPALAEALWPPLRPALERVGLGALPRHALQAPVILALVLAIPILSARTGRADATAPGRLRGIGATAIAAALVVLGFVASGWHGPPKPAVDLDWRDIAAQARGLSKPSDQFLTPPDLDGFRFYSHRPIVVDFGQIAHGDLAGWRDRMNAVTGDAGVLAPSPEPTASREARIASAYDRVAPSAPELVRRYGVRYVVARRAALPALPVWAEPVASNATYVLLKVRSWIFE